MADDVLLAAYQPADLVEGQRGEQVPRVGGEQLLPRQLFQQPPGQRQHGGVQAALRVFQDHDGARALLQLPVAPRLQQGGRHARHRQLQCPVVGIAQQRLQIAGVAQGHGAIDDLPLAARLVLDGGQRVEVMIHQLAHRLQCLLEFGLADALGLVDQLVGQLAQPVLGEIPHCRSPPRCGRYGHPATGTPGSW